MPPFMGNRVSAGWGGLPHLVSMLRMSGAISCTSGYFPDGPDISHRRSRTRVFRGSTLATRRPEDPSQREGPFPQPAGAIRFRRLFATGIAHYPLRAAALSQTTHLAFGHLFPNCHKLRRDSSTRLAGAMGRAGRCLACRLPGALLSAVALSLAPRATLVSHDLFTAALARCDIAGAFPLDCAACGAVPIDHAHKLRDHGLLGFVYSRVSGIVHGTG